MKTYLDTLNKLRSLPEYKRKLIAYATIIILASLIATGWATFLAPEIPGISVPSKTGLTPHSVQENSRKDPLSPIGGIIESLKGIGTLFLPRK